MIDAWLRRSWVWWLAVLIWVAVLFALSAESHPPMGPELPFKDKILHAGYFAAGAFCFLMTGQGLQNNRRPLRVVLVALLFTAVTGALDEWHQSFTPGRSGNDVFDWLADVTGGLIGAWVAIKAWNRSALAS